MSEPSHSPGFDPAQDVFVNTHNLRGLAHPIRMQMLGILRRDGPATATQLAQRIGESSAATSYHLRQLAAYGFITDDERPAKGRERWWRAAHRSTYFEMPEGGSPEDRILAAEYLRNVVRAYSARMEASLDSWSETPPEWRDASSMSDYRAWLTPAEGRALVERLEQIGTELRDRYTEQRPGTAPVSFQFQVLPEARTGE
jgi:DNA-binding transcriptional ArsR family regulator